MNRPLEVQDGATPTGEMGRRISFRATNRWYSRPVGTAKEGQEGNRMRSGYYPKSTAQPNREVLFGFNHLYVFFRPFVYGARHMGISWDRIIRSSDPLICAVKFKKLKKRASSM